MEFASLGSLYTYLSKNNANITWDSRLEALLNIGRGLNHLHESHLTHGDFHPGNLLFNNNEILLITDLGLCKPANQKSDGIYGVMPYVAPEVLKGDLYTPKADVYSFGMVMYFMATGQQPFANYSNDQQDLASHICFGGKPVINEPEIPKCYMELMKRCWDSNPNNRPVMTEVKDSIKSFINNNSIKEQFEEAEEFRKKNVVSSIENSQSTTYLQDIYISQLLNPYIKDLEFDFRRSAIFIFNFFSIKLINTKF